jgi:hypothetical protein
MLHCATHLKAAANEVLLIRKVSAARAACVHLLRVVQVPLKDAPHLDTYVCSLSRSLRGPMIPAPRQALAAMLESCRAVAFTQSAKKLS